MWPPFRPWSQRLKQKRSCSIFRSNSIRAFLGDTFLKTSLGRVRQPAASCGINHGIGFDSFCAFFDTTPKVRRIGMSSHEDVAWRISKERVACVEILNRVRVLAALGEFESIG